jgi:hypothetical protein
MLQVIQQQQLDRRFISLTTSTPSTPTNQPTNQESDSSTSWSDSSISSTTTTISGSTLLLTSGVVVVASISTLQWSDCYHLYNSTPMRTHLKVSYRFYRPHAVAAASVAIAAALVHRHTIASNHASCLRQRHAPFRCLQFFCRCFRS